MTTLHFPGFQLNEMSDRVELTCIGCGEPMIFTPVTTLGDIEAARLEHSRVCAKPKLIRRELHNAYCGQCDRRYTCGSISCQEEDGHEGHCYLCRDPELKRQRWIF